MFRLFPISKISKCLTPIVFVGQVVAGDLQEASFWEQRRVARSAHQNQNASPSVQSIVRPFGAVRVIDPPSNPSNTVVYIVQDVHGQLLAQQNIANVIDVLSSAFGVRWVGLEGASGPLAESEFRSYSRDTVASVAENFLKKDLIGGAEWAALRSDTILNLWGVENEDLYNANVNALRLALNAKTKLAPVIHSTKSALLQLKKTHYNTPLHLFDQRRARYESGEISLADFVSHRPDPALYPRIARLVDLLKADKSLDYSLVEQDRKRFLTRTRDTGTTIEYEPLTAQPPHPPRRATFPKEGREKQDLSSPFGRSVTERPARVATEPLIQGQSEGAGFAGKTETVIDNKPAPQTVPPRDPVATNLVEEHGNRLRENGERHVSLRFEDDFPALSRYLQYLEESEALVSDDLIDELNRWELNTLLSLATTHDQKLLAQLDEDVRLLDRLLTLRLTPDQWTLYQNRRAQLMSIPDRLKQWDLPLGMDTHRITSRVAPFESFFARAADRNAPLADGLLQKMEREKLRSAAVVAGGFHTPGLIERFTQKGVGVVVITPKSDPFIDGNSYTDTFFSSPAVSLKKRCGLANPRVVALLHQAILALVQQAGLRDSRWALSSIFLLAPSLAHAAERNLYETAIGIAATFILLLIGFAADNYFKNKTTPAKNRKPTVDSILFKFYANENTPYSNQLKTIANNVRVQLLNEFPSSAVSPTYEDEQMKVYLTPEYRLTIIRTDFKRVMEKLKFAKKNLGGRMAPFSYYRGESKSLIVIQKRVKSGMKINRIQENDAILSLFDFFKYHGSYLDLKYRPSGYGSLQLKTSRSDAENEFLDEFGLPYGEMDGRIVCTDPLAMSIINQAPLDPKRVPGAFYDKIRAAQAEYLSGQIQKTILPRKNRNLSEKNILTWLMLGGLLSFGGTADTIETFSNLMSFVGPIGSALMVGSTLNSNEFNRILKPESTVVAELVNKVAAYDFDSPIPADRKSFLKSVVEDIYLETSDSVDSELPLKSTIATAAAVVWAALKVGPADQRNILIEKMKSAGSFNSIIAFCPPQLDVRNLFRIYLAHFREQDDRQLSAAFESLPIPGDAMPRIQTLSPSNALFPNLSLISSVGLGRISGAGIISDTMKTLLLRYDLLRDYSFHEGGEPDSTTVSKFRGFINEQISLAEKSLKQENSEINRLRLLALVELRLSPKLTENLGLSKPLLSLKEKSLLKTTFTNTPLMSRVNRAAYCMAQLRALKSSVLEDDRGNFGSETAHARDLELLIGALRLSEENFDALFDGAAATYNTILLLHFENEFWSALATPVRAPISRPTPDDSVMDIQGGIVFDMDALITKEDMLSGRKALVAETLKRLLLSVDENQLRQRLVLITSFNRKPELREVPIPKAIAILLVKEFKDPVFFRVQQLTVLSPENNISGAFTRPADSSPATSPLTINAGPLLAHLKTQGKTPTQFWTHDPRHLKGVGFTVFNILDLAERIKIFFERHAFISKHA